MVVVTEAMKVEVVKGEGLVGEDWEAEVPVAAAWAVVELVAAETAVA